MKYKKKFNIWNMTELLPRKMNKLSTLKWQTPLPSWYIDKHQILYIVHVFLYSTYLKHKKLFVFQSTRNYDFDFIQYT